MKTSLKLLIVFVEYAETNALLLIQAVNTVDLNRKMKPWCNIMQILTDLTNKDDLELILYSMILINTVLNAIPDQDTFYDVSDAYEEQGMQRVIQHYLKNTIKDENGLYKQIVQQMELYEAALTQEDGEEVTGYEQENSTIQLSQINNSFSNSLNNKSKSTNSTSLAPNLR
jgi:hypothetical protein